MKRIIGIVVAAVLMTLTACSSNNKGGAAIGNTRPPGANGQPFNTSSGYGDVTGANLQANIAQMFGANGSEIGTIASTPDGNTGVFFTGSVQSNASVLSGGALQATAGSLNFQVWDSNVGQLDSNGQQIPPITIGMTLANAQFNGQQVTLTFQDQQGQFIFSGNYNQTTFQGQLSYNSSSTGQIQIGSFNVATCAFLRCQ